MYLFEGVIILMKSILSPYDDARFNEYLLEYAKKYLKKKCNTFVRGDEDRKYFLDENSRDYYTPDDVIKSLALNGRVIYFSNQKLINYIVYDLSQRFWFDCLKYVHNIIHKLYLEFKNPANYEANIIQRRKLSHVKRAQQRLQEAKR